MGQEQSRQNRLTTNAIAADTFSVANAFAANASVLPPPPLPLLPPLLPPPLSSPSSTAQIITCAGTLTIRMGRCIASLLPEEKASHSHKQQYLMSPQVDSALHSSTSFFNNDDPGCSVVAVAAGSGNGDSQKFGRRRGIHPCS